ncbi:MAG: polyribonucleotide nucleotidyltransferase [Acidobacteriaceae bacterium]
MKHEVTVALAGGKSLIFETGRLAKQAHGAVVVRQGDSVVLTTAVSSPDPREGIDFFPLTVDYREYTYAGGRIPGGFIKREGRPSEREILISRQIDRPCRPLFPEGYRNETQIISLVLSADAENDPDVCAINGASAALAISDIPFMGPVGAVRVGLVNGQMLVNPSYSEMKESQLNIMVVGTESGIVMIESGAKGVTEDQVVDAIDFGHEQIKIIVGKIKELVQQAGKTKREVKAPEFDQAYYDEMKSKIGDRLIDALDTRKHPKLESYSLVKQIKDELKADLPADDKNGPAKISKYYEALRENIFREAVTKRKVRPDHRGFDEIRAIDIEIGVLPRTHGSAVFQRGETQALVTTTLGTSDDVQRIENYLGDHKKNFMLHYNFPPFSVGEVGRMTGVGRREVGHGALAERAITAVLPEADAFPYTLRVVSDILESNGSSSMATVCGASLSLMDAGVPIKAPVAGVAMGLVKEGDDYAILTDIAGAEDHYGDMDFKVAGTREGITALQMDIKISGITGQIMREALEQARRGRLFILDKMQETIAGARQETSKFAPRIHTLQIPPDKIRDLIGPGGKMIRSIVDATGVKIDVDDSGKVNVASADETAMARAIQMISDITAVPEVGKTYLGKVVRLAEFGAFVEIFPGTDGLLHISEIAEHRVNKVQDELKEGDQVLVKVLGLEGNRIKLSRKAVIKEQKAKLGITDDGGSSSNGDGQRSDRGDRGDRGSRSERGERPSRPRREEPSTPAAPPADAFVLEGGDDFEEEEGFEEGDELEGDEESEGTGAPATETAGAPQGGRTSGSGAASRGRRRRRRGGP